MALWVSMLIALITAFLGCWLITSFSVLRMLGNVEPVKERWHKSATPGLGGVPIYLGLAAGVISLNAETGMGLALLVSAAPLLVLGAYDDVKALTPKIKLTGQIASALLVCILLAFNLPDNIVTSFTVNNYVFTAPANRVMLGAYLLVCVFWIVAIINAVNLLDNMDGLAGGVSLIACLCIATITGQTPAFAAISSFYFIISAALAGFLLLNYNPAKLFMGDAGALWIGLVVGIGAIFVVLAQSANPHPIASTPLSLLWLLPALICTVPISDTIMVTVTRKLRGQPASVGGSDHLSHRLVCLGFGERTAVAILWLAAGIGAFIAIVAYVKPMHIGLFPMFSYFIAVGASIIALTQLTSAPEGIALKNT